MRYWILIFVAATILLAFNSRREADAGDVAIKALNLDRLNTDSDEEDPFPSPDGTSLLYASNALGTYDIYFSKRPVGSTAFPQGKPFMFDKTADERSPFMVKDKYYYAANEVKDPKFAKLKNFDLLTKSGMLAPLFLPGNVNSPADELYPWIIPGGKEIYFSRKTDEGWKLFYANGPTPGPIGDAKQVGFPAGFHRAAIVGMGGTMYLQGPLDSGRIGIFRSKRGKIGDRWSKPEEVTVLNHPKSKKGDMHPALTTDGTKLYFVSDRPGGKGGLDIWMVNTALLK